MGATMSSPACPGLPSYPFFGLWKVTVRSACTHSPWATPVSATSPVGTSMAILYASARFIAWTICRYGGRRAPRMLVPIKPSTMASALISGMRDESLMTVRATLELIFLTAS